MTLFRIGFEVTSRCNLRCRHCLRGKPSQPRDFDVDLMDRLLGEGKKFYGLQHAALTGGEPLLHPDLPRILDLFVKHDYSFTFVSNGFYIPERIALFKAPEIKRRLIGAGISLDGPGPEANDAIRGEGAYRRAMAAIMVLKAAGIPVAVKYTIGRHNLDSIESAILAISHLGIEKLEAALMIPTPENMAAGLVPDPEECRAAASAVARLGQEMKLPIYLTTGAHSNLRFYSCSALAMTEIYVDAGGRLRLCCDLPGRRDQETDPPERDVIADLNREDLLSAHHKLIGVIGELQHQRVERIAEGLLTPIDLFPCMACARYFGKLDWLEAYPGNPWRRGALAKEASNVGT
jgi:MoaA/NifB/PqqE/SkfB family radical SAM enzyme